MTKYDHAEAFCLMWYACTTAGCGHRERIYNSRDGVTAFTIVCPSCGEATLSHTQFNRDERRYDYTPHNGQRVWITLTPRRAEEIALASAKRVQEQSGDSVPKRDIAKLAKRIYNDGQEPDLMVFGYRKGKQQ